MTQQSRSENVNIVWQLSVKICIARQHEGDLVVWATDQEDRRLQTAQKQLKVLKKLLESSCRRSPFAITFSLQGGLHQTGADTYERILRLVAVVSDQEAGENGLLFPDSLAQLRELLDDRVQRAVEGVNCHGDGVREGRHPKFAVGVGTGSSDDVPTASSEMARAAHELVAIGTPGTWELESGEILEMLPAPCQPVRQSTPSIETVYGWLNCPDTENWVATHKLASRQAFAGRRTVRFNDSQRRLLFAAACDQQLVRLSVRVERELYAGVEREAPWWDLLALEVVEDPQLSLTETPGVS